MRISYQWLKDYVDLAVSPEETANLLTMAGLEVERVEAEQPPIEGVVVGRIGSVRAHPTADRLTLCEVDLGEPNSVQIVCGAPNVEPGQYVPVATVGTQLQLPVRSDPGMRHAVTIQRAKLVGEWSEGMICSADELGLSDDRNGIMVLGDDARPGEPLYVYLERSGTSAGDAVLDVAVTPNRPDATSHIGIARDLAALLQTPLRLPSVAQPESSDRPAVPVGIEVPEACPRYVAIVVRGVRVGESPPWLQSRLRAVGLRPRNNVVDVTNYVMFECGQPLHAFDLDALAGRMILVRASQPGEPFTTLDGRSRVLPEGAVLICDRDRPVAIGGIMGGENSEVTGETTDLLIESAYFDPTTIRRTARALGLQTDSSYRFERGVDAAGQVWAAARAARLIVELAGGEVIPGAVDANPRPFEGRQVDLRISRVESILGTNVPRETVQRLLTAIGFGLSERGEDVFACVIPSHRPDVEREIDVIEEVARLHGFDGIPEPSRTALPAIMPRERPVDVAGRSARLILEGQGYREIVTNSMLRSETARRFLDPTISWMSGEVVETLNPISQEMSALRPSLLPGALEVMQHNRNRGQARLRFFEFGHVFRHVPEGGGLVRGYDEQDTLVVAGSGPRHAPGLYSGGESFDFFDVRGLVEELTARLRLPPVRFETGRGPTEMTSQYVAIVMDDERIGSIGRLAEHIAAHYDLDSAVYYAELAWDRLVSASRLHLPAQYRRISRFPVVDRDLAFVVPLSQEVGPLLGAIRQEAGDLLSQVDIFDIYEGKGVVDGFKSVAFSLRFGGERTLTDAEVDERIGAVVGRVRQDFHAELRS